MYGRQNLPVVHNAHDRNLCVAILFAAIIAHVLLRGNQFNFLALLVCPQVLLPNPLGYCLSVVWISKAFLPAPCTKTESRLVIGLLRISFGVPVTAFSLSRAKVWARINFRHQLLSFGIFQATTTHSAHINEKGAFLVLFWRAQQSIRPQTLPSRVPWHAWQRLQRGSDPHRTHTVDIHRPCVLRRHNAHAEFLERSFAQEPD